MPPLAPVAAHPVLGSGPLPRNPGAPLDLDWVASLRVDRSAAERRAASLTARRAVKGTAQAAWLLKAITLIDLTTLAGDDTPARVRRLCAKARAPVRRDLLEALGMADAGISVAAVCVYGAMVGSAVAALAGSRVPVASVATAFPAGLTPLETRLAEIEAAVRAGAAEVDVVIRRHLALAGDWRGLYDEVRAFRNACGAAHLKVILATGDLGGLRTVARASLVAMLAGADFVKTSTGKESVNATLPVSLVMARVVREYAERTGVAVGFKAAGGIRTATEALAWMILMREELGRRWLEGDLFRFGASGLLADIERQLEHFVTGRYAALHAQPLA
jgi:deoxyribose-phosphate aldolase